MLMEVGCSRDLSGGPPTAKPFCDVGEMLLIVVVFFLKLPCF